MLKALPTDQDPLRICTAIISEVLQSRSATSNNEILSKMLEHHVLKGFEFGVLDPGRDEFIVKASATFYNTLVLWIECKKSTNLYRVSFYRIHIAVWRLMTFETGCPACFGDAGAGGEICGLCQGSGFVNDVKCT